MLISCRPSPGRPIRRRSRPTGSGPAIRRDHPIRRILAGRPASAEIPFLRLPEARGRDGHLHRRPSSRSRRKKQFLVDTALTPNAFWIQGIGPNPRADARRRRGGRTAAPSPSSTTSAATRSTGSSKSTPRPGKPARSSTRKTRPSSPIRTRSTATMPATERKSSGCPSGTAGTISTSTTAGPGRSRTRSPRANGSSGAWTRSTRRPARSGSGRAGIVPGQDPYLIHSCRINFDGTGFTVADRGERDPHRRLLRRT